MMSSALVPLTMDTIVPLLAVSGLVREDCNEVFLSHRFIYAQGLSKVVCDKYPVGCMVALLPFGVIAQMMFV